MTDSVKIRKTSSYVKQICTLTFAQSLLVKAIVMGKLGSPLPVSFFLLLLAPGLHFWVPGGRISPPHQANLCLTPARCPTI